jgi:deoxyribodipyrimidine photolyase-related protein
MSTLRTHFLLHHETLLARNPRTALQVRNPARLDGAERGAIQDRAGAIGRGEVGTPA